MVFLALLAISDWCFCLFWRDETRKSGKLEVSLTQMQLALEFFKYR